MREIKKIKTAIRAILIARVSTEPQGNDDRFSIPAQWRNLRAYFDRGKESGIFNGEKEEEVLEESAYSNNRPKFEKIVEGVKAHFNLSGESTALVFDDIDRFSRNTANKVVLEVEELRREGGIEIHSLSSEPLCQNASAGVMLNWKLRVAIAEFESARKSERSKNSNKEKLERGLYPAGEVPTGYIWMQKKVEVDEEREGFIKKCFNLYFTGRYTTESLAEEMRGLGFSTKTGKLVSYGDLASILKNPFYYGEFYYKNPDTGKRELWDNKGSYKPLITKKLFDEVQKVVAKRNTRINGHSKNHFKFAKLLSCGFCGHTLTAEEMSRTYANKKKDSLGVPVYYHCNNGRTHKDKDWYRKEFGTEHSGVHIYKGKEKERKGETVYACPQKWWREEEIEDWILKELECLDYGEEVFTLFRDMLEEELGGRVEIANNEIKRAKAERTRNQALIKGFVHSLATEKEPELREDYRVEYNKVKEKQKQIQEKIDTFEKSIVADTDETVQALRYSSNLRKQYEGCPDSKKREMLSVFFSKLEGLKGEYRLNKGKGRMFNADQINFVWREPFDMLRKINLQELLTETEGKSYDLVNQESLDADYEKTKHLDGERFMKEIENDQKKSPSTKKNLDEASPNP